MYITTFYSFKGGVGRTMALVNAAVELANRGRRVLAVDFDLEAPGLDSFRVLRPPSRGKVPGIVDFVHEYLDTAQSPDESRFRYQVPGVGNNGGELWVMPAGADRRDYGVRYRELDWNHLYARRDGYLLLEDLKAQWEKHFQADWVFLDSRTGHTDTGGICTRHLPDAVVAVFFPNDQNLRGLSRVVRQIRAEAATPRKKEIALHFLMSNVPDLDDEDDILRRQIASFRSKLLMDRGSPLIVHRYDSLALLNQAVFVQERPRSRLAREYRRVVEAILRENLEDRDGALLYLRRFRRISPWRRGALLGKSAGRDEDLRQIEKTHDGDEEVLCELGRLFEARRRPDDAARLFGKAISVGSRAADALLFRASDRAERNDFAGANRDAMRVLATEDLAPWEVAAALEVAHAPVKRLMDTVAIRSLSPIGRWEIGDRLAKDGDGNIRRIGRAMLESLDAASLPHRLRWDHQHALSLLYLREGRCAEAVDLLTRTGRALEEGKEIVDAFNLGMATWGAAGTVDPEPFRRVVALAGTEQSARERDANFFQSLAVAHWAAGEGETACARLGEAKRALSASGPPRLMSCWRYAEVPPSEFLDDLREIRALIEGDASRRPRFMTTATRAAAAERAGEGAPVPADGPPRPR